MPTGLLLCIKGQVLLQQRTRTNKRQLPFDDIEQLGEFIKARFANELAKRGQPFFIRQENPLFVACLCHTTKLVHIKRLAVKAWPTLHKQNRPTEKHSDQHGGDEQDGRKHNDERKRDEEIKQSLHTITPRKPLLPMCAARNFARLDGYQSQLNRPCQASNCAHQQAQPDDSLMHTSGDSRLAECPSTQ
ncbi:hypothetical protein EV213_10942 [Aureibacillus halotolerans]|uniref:Uncharacterized protein n=1 Tax=Aureibacillus halotolerans TaxID=1508390 RepID=A0A4R6U6M5_9BACI|nr:hypothetical protein EV213_10942 [Aureibacillus halotolerans]